MHLAAGWAVDVAAPGASLPPAAGRRRMNESQDRKDAIAEPAESGMDGRDVEASGPEGFLTYVCVKCGNEYYFGESEIPAPLECGRCSNTVFRGYFTHESEDEAAADFEDSTHRDLHTDDAEGDAMPGDVLDLNPD
jgi:DNA-directed RNA polymerase subunit RPC12/RpoP